MKRKAAIVCLNLLISLSALQAQNLLNNPEHVVYDSLNQRYLVTNYGNGKIVSIDHFGNQEVVLQGLSSCLGIHIVDSTVFITAGQQIRLYDLNTFAFVNAISPGVTNWLDGMIDDGAGFLYVAENAGKIHRIDLSDYSYTTIVNSGLPSYPQDLAYDPIENRLLLVCWANYSAITAISLDDYSVTPLISTNSGQYDGIVRDEDGNLFVSSWLGGGKIYKWEYPYLSDPIIVSQGHAGPAGLGYNVIDKILAVPNFNGNSVSFLDATVAAEENEIPATESLKLHNYPNPFNPSTTISFETTNFQEFQQIEIYNVKGQKVKVLDCGSRVEVKATESLSHSVIWDGTDFNGQTVTSGIYFAVMKQDNRTIASKKMMQIK